MLSFAPHNSLTNPFDLSNEAGYFWLKGNLHCHSTASDGRATPQERVNDYLEQGYNFLSITDHLKITPLSELIHPPEFVLIPGVELHPDNPFGGQRYHLLALNVQEDINSPQMPPQHVIDAVNQQGGLVWLAHPYWSSINVMRDVLPLHGLAGIEIFNTNARRWGRGESGVHWDDWMSQENKLYPAIATDDAHRTGQENLDTYQSWTMVRVREHSISAIMQALKTGASYSSTGPEIHDVQFTPIPGSTAERRIVNVSLRVSPCQRIAAIGNVYGGEYQENGEVFTSATFTLRPNTRWVRFEIIAPDGQKAWSNPFDLIKLTNHYYQGGLQTSQLVAP